MDRDVNSIFYWWPIVKDLNIPMPETTLIPYSGDIFINPDEPNEQFDKFVARVRKACDKYGYPVFIRCGGLSGKHEWKETCYVDDPETLDVHIFRIIEQVLMVMGVRLDFDGIAVREFLHIENRFTAFGGDMPIGKEFRFFARDGEYECHHPYWPPTAIWNPSVDDWYEQLKEMQTLTEDELTLLKRYTRLIAQALDKGPLGTGWWSIDFCKTVDGLWYLTDLGVGEVSFHWNVCPNAAEDMKHYPSPDDPEKLAKIRGPTQRMEWRKKLDEKYGVG